MKKQTLKNCGTVMSIDLTKDKIFGEVVVELTGDEIGRICTILIDYLPIKTEKDKKNKDVFISTISKLSVMAINMEVDILPVLNKSSLKEWNAYKVQKSSVR